MTQPLCSSRITGLHRSYGLVRPSALHRYARLVVSATCASPFTSERLFPAVPHESPGQIHASYTPAAACPVTRYPTGSSQEMEKPLVLTTLYGLRRFSGGSLAFVSLTLTCSGYVPVALTPMLTTTAFDRSSLEVVWDLLLKTDPEGPTLINYTARSRLIRSCDLLIRAPLQHTKSREVALQDIAPK